MKKIYSAASYWKIITTAIALTCFGFAARTQQVTIEGTGTASSYLYSPIYSFDAVPRSFRIAYIYSQPLMATMPSGSFITKLQFSRANAAPFPAGNNLKLYLMNTATANWGAGALTWNVAGATLVYDGDPSIVAGSTAGYKEFVLIAPFQYTGSNLAIFAEYSQVNAPFESLNWHYNTSATQPGYSDNQTKYTVNSSATMPATLSTSTANHANIKIDFSPTGVCTSPPVPGNVSVLPDSIVCAGSNVTLSLTGYSPGTGQTYQWESAATSGGAYSPVGGVLTSPTLNTTVAAGTFYYRCAVTCGGNTQHSDTVSITGRTTLNGNYTINSAVLTGGTNFQSFTAAAAALACGVSGPVTITVVPGSGPYTEQITIPSIPGSSAVNTVTIYGSGETLQATPVAALRQLIRLDGADYVTIRRLNIQAQSGSTYGWGIHLTNGANFNTIDSCIIDISAVTSATQSNSGGIVGSGSPTVVTTAGNANDNTISHNTIIGAYQGIILIGTATATNAVNNIITKNTIRDFYANGIEITHNNGAQVSYNDIHRANRPDVTTFAGIEMGAGNRNCVINANRIHDTHTSAETLTGTAYGIYSNACDAPAAAENRVTNNLVYNFNSASGTIYGLYNSGSDGVFYYHNTVSLDHIDATAGVTRGIYQTTLASRIEYKNNMISIARGGTGVKHCIYMNIATTTYASDFNNFYIPAGTDHFIGYNGSSHATLAAWQTASTKDANSLSINPQYLDPASGNYSPNVVALDNKGTPVGVTLDIQDLARSAVTPDIGAYEFAVIVCTDPPTPGTVVSNTNPVCSGGSFRLSINGGTVGAGLTRQWQSSPDNSNWTDIPGATGTIYDATQTQTTYYRVVYTCGATVPSASLQVVSPIALAGTFTINSSQPTGGSNFTSFADAYTAIRCGIAGAITFDVMPGLGAYNEQLIIDSIPGTSLVNTITFNGNGNTITWLATDTEERATIKLRGADYITFDSLVVEATGSASNEYGWGIQLMTNADSNTVRRCTININTTATTTAFAGIVVNNSATSPTTGSAQSDKNTFDRNTINGGYYSMIMMGTASVVNFDNKITRNTFKDFYFYGLYVNGSTETLVDSNIFTRPTRSVVGEFNGIYFTGLSSRAMVTRNTISNGFGGNTSATTEFNGIVFTSNDPTPANVNRVINNLVYNTNGNGNATGIYNSSSNNVWFFHNTVVLDGAPASNTATNFTRGFYQTGEAAGIEFKNNIVSIIRDGLSTKHVMYFNTPASTIVSDSNDLYISSNAGNNYIGFIVDNRPIITDWQLFSGQDLHSVTNDPLFVNPASGDYTPSNVSINNIGAALGVVTDITGAPRSLTTPDPGAFEFSPPACITPPTAGAAGVSNTPVCENSFVLLSITGHSTGVGQTYVWQSSTTINGTYANISGTLTNPAFTVTATATLYYRVAVTCGGNTGYSTPVLLTVTPGLPGGVYTIDQREPQTPTNFPSFNAAREAMACGITGPVVFNVEPGSGPYLEQVIFDTIPGTSRDNTVTFNGNGNVIQFSSSASAERAVIKLNSTDHFTFDSLIVDATGTGTYGFGIQFMNNADSNTIRRCTILANTTATTVNFAGIVMSASATSGTTTGNTLCDYNTIQGNTIIGGQYGITLTGSVTAKLQNNRIYNNKIQDFYLYGIYVNGNNRVHIEGNDIERPIRTNSATTGYGIYLTAQSTLSNINANRIHNMMGGMLTSANDVAGIYITAVDAVASEANLVTNNAIYNMNGNGFIYGIYSAGSDYVKYYHNTVSLDHTTSTSTDVTRGFYMLTDAEGVDFKNNIVTIRRGGTGTKNAFYIGTGTIVYTSDRNDLFVDAANAHVGYLGGNQTTLANWQTATSQDAASLSLDPQFTSPVTGDLTPQLGAIDNMSLPVGVTTDILGQTRSATTPDVGAFEFAVIPCTSPPTAGAALAAPVTGFCLGETVALDLTGNSGGGFQTYKWQRGPSATGPWTDISAELFSPQFNHIISSTDTWFRAIVTCSGGTPQNSDPVQITLNSLLVGGDYTIDPGIPQSPANFWTFGEAVAILNCGITGPVRFHVAAGTYNEQVRIRPVPGSSTVNTVTFRSQNGDPSSVLLTYNATASAANYVLKLDSASNIIFRDISVTATHSSNGRAIELAGTASNDSILNCKVHVPVSSSTSNNIAGIFATSLTGSDNVIKGNTVTNGSSGIYLSGMTLVSNRMVVDSNRVDSAYYYGVYLANINRIQANKNTVTRSGLMNTSAYGIYLSNCDSAFQVNSNNVDIENSGTTIYGIYLTGCQSAEDIRGSVSGNKVTGRAANTGNQYGIYITTSTLANVRNNSVVTNTSGITSYGTYVTGTGGINFQNNSVQSNASSATNNIAAYFSQTSAANGVINIRNNIFSHTGNGRAMSIVNPQFIYSDYNMFFTSGDTLVQWGNSHFRTLQQWRDTSYWDFNSIQYAPAFTNATDLQPDLASPNVWAIHGRGVQIPGNSTDINNNPRPVLLTEGVPDLGAYEFVPTSLPIVLTATPATPVANSMQVFMLGTDTVTKITWGATVPTTVTGRRYTGTIPIGITAGQDHMYFYTDFDITGTTPTGHTVKQYYMDPWLGFIDNESIVKLGRTDNAGAWQVATGSQLDSVANTMQEGSLTLLDKYTGLTDGIAPPTPPIVISPSDLSNSGTKFWVAYGHQYYFSTNNSQSMVLYLGAGQNPASVTVKVNGTSWSKTYNVPANTTIASDFMPKFGAFDARLLQEGWSDRGISIESNTPITAFAHIYSSQSSGATMLMPLGSYGYEYYALTSKQNYSGNSYSWFYVVAPYDSTVVEITPSNPTLGGRPAGVPFTVMLKKGEVYQVLGQKTGTSAGYDMTGSKVRSIANSVGKCYPIAMFSGSSRTAIACDDAVPTLNGDNIIQQNFPYRAWGKRYLTAPTSASTAANTMHTNIYKVAVKDPTTVVTVNGVLQTNLINGLYYQFTANTSMYIEADKPVMVAQFIGSTSECGGSGVYDPEMIYLSPIEQGIKKVGLYRNTEDAITVQYLTLIIPTNGVNSLMIDGSNTFDYVYDHYLTGYKVVVKRWTATSGPTIVQSDSAFTGITYGLGSVESYGYNAGTLILNLNVTPTITNVFNPAGTPNDYTCAGTPFRVSFLSTVQPNTIEWSFSQVPNISPNADVVQNNPTPVGTEVINGVIYYRYTLAQQYVISTPGTYNIPIAITHPDVEGCNNRMPSSIPVTVIGAPVADFDNLVAACPGTPVQFTGTGSTVNGVPIVTWNWNFGDVTTGTGQTTTHTYTNAGTYNVELGIIAAEGCIASITKPVTVGNGPVVDIVPDSVGVCPGDNATFTIQNPVANTTYEWYTTPTGGSPVATGTSYTITNITTPVSYYVGSLLGGCPGVVRKRVQVTVRPALPTPVVVVDSTGTNLVRFRWSAVPGATSYEVTTNGGANWVTPSSGTTGLTHTVTGLTVGQTVTLQVRALGGCLPSVSQPVSGTAVTDQLFLPNAFTPNNDGRNDDWRIYGNVIRSIRAMIFNQWGEKISEATNPSRGGDGGYRIWDGTHKGQQQPSGVYIYVCEITLVDGSKVTRKGSINLAR